MKIRSIVIGLLIILMITWVAEATVIRNGSSGWVNSTLYNAENISSNITSDKIEIGCNGTYSNSLSVNLTGLTNTTGCLATDSGTVGNLTFYKDSAGAGPYDVKIFSENSTHWIYETNTSVSALAGTGFQSYYISLPVSVNDVIAMYSLGGKVGHAAPAGSNMHFIAGDVSASSAKSGWTTQTSRRRLIYAWGYYPASSIIGWYNSGSGNEVYAFEVNVSSQTNANYSFFYGNNASGTWTQIGTANATGNQSINLDTLALTKYQNTDYKWECYSNLTASCELLQVTLYEQATSGSDTTPPTPSFVSNIIGPDYINHTWQSGSGVVTDSYNISVNGSWAWILNGSLTVSANLTGLVAGDWNNITIWAWNSTGNGNLSSSSITNTSQIPLGAGDQVLDSDISLFWMRTDGNDSCNGQNNMSYAINSTDCAWLTLDKAGSTLTAGQTINVVAGDYATQGATFDNSGNSTAWITYNALEGNNFTTTPGLAVFITLALNAQYINISGFNVYNYDRFVFTNDGVGHITVNHNNIYNHTSSAIASFGEGNNITIHGNYVEGVTPSNSAARQIYVASQVKDRIYDVVITDNTAKNGWHNTIEVMSNVSNISIENNTVDTGTNGGGIALHNYDVHNATIRNNTIRNQSKAILLIGVDEFVIENNTIGNFDDATGTYMIISQCEQVNDARGFHRGTIGNGTIRNNTINYIGTEGAVFWTDSSSLCELDWETNASAIHPPFYNITFENNDFRTETDVNDDRIDPSRANSTDILYRDIRDTNSYTFKWSAKDSGDYYQNYSFEFTDNKMVYVISGSASNLRYYLDRSNGSVPNTAGASLKIGLTNNTITPSENYTTVTNNTSAINLNYTGLISNTTITLGVGESKNINLANVSGTTYDLIFTGNSTNIESKTASGGIVNFTTTLGEGSYSILEDATPESDYIPPTPISLTETNGSFWVEYSWAAGVGNITDSYNITLINNSITYNINGTTQTSITSNLGAAQWSNITVQAYNSSGNGTLNDTGVSDQTQTPSETCSGLQSGTTINIGNCSTLLNLTYKINNATALEDQGSNIYFLNANLVNNLSTNYFYINSSDTLRINSSNTSGVGVAWDFSTTAGHTEINGSTITSWNTSSNSADSQQESDYIHNPRSHITATGALSYLNITNATIIGLGGAGTTRTERGIGLSTSAKGLFQNSSFLNVYSIEADTAVDGFIVRNNTITVNDVKLGDSDGVYLYATTNAQIYGNNITLENAPNSYGLLSVLGLSTNNNFYDNTIHTTASGSHGIRIYSSRYNTFTNNTVIVEGDGAYALTLDTTSQSNTITQGSYNSSGATNAYALYMNTAYNNSISGISFNGTTDDIYLTTAPVNNSYSNLDLANGKIYFANTASGYNYSDDSIIWIQTNVSSITRLTRAINSWNNINLNWNDTNSTVGITTNYTISGLIPNINYNVHNTSLGNRINSYSLVSDGSGTVSTFDISLNNNTQIELLPSYIPPNVTSMTYTNGSLWVNHTWQPGTGNVTDSYNVSHNGIWTNGTTLNYSNNTVGAGAFSNISVYSYNISGSGTLNTTAISQNVQTPSSSFTASNNTIVCPVGWCYLAMNDTNKTLLQLDNMFSTDVVQGWFNSTSQKFESHSKFDFNKNINVTNKSGYFYYFKTATNVSVNITGNPTITLKSGWNLVGNMDTARNLSTLKTSIGANATSASHWNNTLQIHNTGNSEIVGVGEPFFVNVNADTSWGG